MVFHDKICRSGGGAIGHGTRRQTMDLTVLPVHTRAFIHERNELHLPPPNSPAACKLNYVRAGSTNLRVAAVLRQ